MTVRDRTQTLRWVSSAVMVAGVVAVCASLVLLDSEIAGLPVWVLPVLAMLVALASASVVRVRVRSTVVGTAWTDAAVVVCIVCLPPAWVPICVMAGVLAAKFFLRVAPRKALYNASKDALAATAGLLVALPLGLSNAPDPLAQPLEIALVGLTVAVVEFAIGAPVLGLASGVPWHRLHRDADIKVTFFVGKLVVAGLTLTLFAVNARLLAVVPPVALSLHLLYASRLRARSERTAWQRLAATTEELNHTDLETVLAKAVTNAVQLFSAEEAEVFLRDGPDGPILVRGDGDGVKWSGDPGKAPARGNDVQSVTARLAGHDLKADVGEVRLHYAVGVRLTERELLTLRTFASALRTAVRNAAAFAEARRLALRNAHAALHDPLTGLANRRRLQEHAEAALATPGHAALVVLDLDQFREVNETLGYLEGDRLLVEVARRLQRAVTADDLVARLDGDEFAVVLTDRTGYAGAGGSADSAGAGAPVDSAGAGAPAGSAEQRVRELLATLDAPIDLSGMRVRVEASAGLAVAEPVRDFGAEPVRDPGAAVVELLRRADVAMYQAKRDGTRVVRYQAAKDTADVAALMLGGDLPRAIAEREFSVSFQPIVDLATGEMVSAEALARWRHPERGPLDPRRFLAAVERSGLLPAFAEAVLDQALAAMKRWQAAGVNAPVAVNASPRSLLDPTFPMMVRERLAHHGAAGSDLVIELTETLTLTQVDLVGGVLRQLRDQGVLLALDDFGTRSSSLAMLAKVPFFELKIDRSFVSAMGRSAEALAVVRSTVELGRTLRRYVVAEGVELEDERVALWGMGCPAGQGHLFAKPMPVDELMATIVEGEVGRICPPMHSAPNVIDLPRPPQPGPARTEEGV